MLSVDTLPKDHSLNALDFLDYALSHQFGDLHFKVDPETGMKAIIAIHSTKLGPALGGCRFIPYANTHAALYDCMRLARGMSYKAALANVPLGGGKSVIIQPPQPFNRIAYMHAFGKFVDELNGRYITALDSGTHLSDMDIINQHTPHVASLSSHNGDPSPFTAHGVVRGIQAAVLFKLGKASLEGLHIAIQGLGHVGSLVATQLHDLGATLTVADIVPEQVKAIEKSCHAHVVSSDVIHKVPCDVFSPCALGGIINDKTITELQTTIIAGAANNQLAHTYHGKHLFDKGILYTPDYVINSGGLIFAASQYLHVTQPQMAEQIDNIKHTLLDIFERSIQENRSVNEISDTMAQEILA